MKRTPVHWSENPTICPTTHQIGAHGIRFGVAKAGDGEGSSTQNGFIKKGPATGATHYTLGYDYNLSKRSSVFAYYISLEE